MNQNQTRAQREAREDPLWAAVWQIWPTAMTLEEETPFDGRLRKRRAI